MRTCLLCLVVALVVRSPVRSAAPPPSARDLEGDPLPAGAIARLGSSRGFQSGAMALAFTPDAARVAAIDRYATVHLWEVATGRLLWRVATPSWGGSSPEWSRLAFSPEGRFLAVGCGQRDDTSIRIFDVATGTEQRRLTTRFPVTVVRFSPQGRQLAIGGQGSPVCLWDWQTDREPLTWAGLSTVTALAYHRAGKTLVGVGHASRTAEPFTLVTWSVPSGKVLHRQEVPRGRFASALSPDGRFFAVPAEDGHSIQLFDPLSGKLLRRTADRASYPAQLAFSADGRALTSISRDGLARVWDTESGKLRWRFRAFANAIECVALSADGKRLAVTAEYEYGLHVWDLSGAAPRRLLGAVPGHRHGPLTVAFAADGNSVFTATRDPVIRRPVRAWAPWSFQRWHPLTGRQLAVVERDPGGEVQWTTFSPDARLLVVVTHEGTMRLWDTHAGKVLRQWMGPTQTFTQVSGTEKTTWNISSLNEPIFSPDGKVLLATDRAGNLHRWDVATGKPLVTFWPWDRDGPPAEPSKVAPAVHHARCVPFPGGETLLAIGWTGSRTRLVPIDAHTGVPRREFPPLNGWVHAAAFSPDGRTLAVGDGHRRGSVLLLEVASGRQRGSLTGGPAFLGALAFSPDGRLLAGAGHTDSLVRVWHLPTGQEVRRLAGHRLGLTTLVFSPDGTHLASSGYDNTALVWQVPVAPSPPVRATPLSREELAARWKDLEGADAARAYRAVWSLVGVPEQAVPEIRARLGKVDTSTEVVLRALEVLEAIRTAEARRLVAELSRGGDEEFTTRAARAVLGRLDRRPGTP